MSQNTEAQNKAIVLEAFDTLFNKRDVNAHDLWTTAVACAVLISVASLAAFIPAWKASRVNPVAALRSE